MLKRNVMEWNTENTYAYCLVHDKYEGKAKEKRVGIYRV